jgi:diacylglycerol kinase (ATP)
MRRALFLYNPTSGRRREQRLRDVNTAAEVFRRAGVEADVQATTAPGSATEQARAAADCGYDVVIVCGGDGSVHEALQGLVNRDIALGVMPLGTGNALANDLKLPREITRAAQQLLTFQTRALKLPRMTFDAPVSPIKETSRYFIVGAGMGADAQLVYKLTLALKGRWGMTAYYAEAWRQWARYSYPLFEVEFRDGDQLRREQVSQVLAIRVEWMGGLLRRIAPGASLHRDDLRLVLVKSRRRWPYVRYVTGLQLNRAWLGRDIELVYAKELTCRRLATERIYAEADGELLATLPVSVAMTNDVVKLLAP